MTPSPVAVALLGAGVALLGVAVLTLARRAREGRVGRLVTVETDSPGLLRSERYRLVGRPDEVRATADGVLVPVELKNRAQPQRGAFFSHTVQVWGYCLLLEEATGRAPPFGIVRYRDGEAVVPWNPVARRALLALHDEAMAPYDGRADPSVGKCSRCTWSRSCDASAVRAPAAR